MIYNSVADEEILDMSQSRVEHAHIWGDVNGHVIEPMAKQPGCFQYDRADPASCTHLQVNAGPCIKGCEGPRHFS